MSLSIPSWRGVIALACIACIGLRWLYKMGLNRRLPPGPKPLPFLGNLLDFPSADVPEFRHWLKHKDKYGPISSVTILGMTMVFIHDKKAANDMLGRFASKTSGRPMMMFANKMCGYESIILCQGYNDTFRRHRKFLHQEIGTKASAATFRHIQEVQVNRRLVLAFNNPENWLEHFKTATSATILKTTYGYTIEPNKPDRLVSLIQKMMTEFSLAAAPLAWMVDIVTALQFLPENFPGGGFKKTARRWRNTIHSVAYGPYGFVEDQMATGSFSPSYVSKLIESLQPDGSETKGLAHEDEQAIIWTAASLYGAAADTMVITLTTFTLAMVLFPEVQRKAQHEIDTVIGTDRLPTFEDRDKLPYINAVVQEALRWWPIAPMGFPHTVDQSFEYDGLHIPKGAYLLPSIWWFLHDPEVYANPDEFDPERFLSPRNEPDPESAFGYGRRVCAGKWFANDGLYINIVQSLATFNIEKPMDATGKAVDIDVKVKPGVLSYPTNFNVKVSPRSIQHVEMIRRLEMEQPWESDEQ